MKMVRTIVYRKRILNSVKRKLSKSNTVCKSSRNLTGTRSITKVTHRVGVSKCDICEISVLIRNDNSDNAGTYA